MDPRTSKNGVLRLKSPSKISYEREAKILTDILIKMNTHVIHINPYIL